MLISNKYYEFVVKVLLTSVIVISFLGVYTILLGETEGFSKFSIFIGKLIMLICAFVYFVILRIIWKKRV